MTNERCHEASGFVCLAAHSGYKDGKHYKEPQCPVCKHCGEFINYDKMNEECPRNKPKEPKNE